MRTLKTGRLILRPLRATDASAVQQVMGQAVVSREMVGYPHPYPAHEGERWVARRLQLAKTGSRDTWALALAGSDDTLRGAVTLRYEWEVRIAEISYWLDEALWGNGYTTEAVSAVLRYGFSDKGLLRVYGRCFVENKSSQRVLVKAGMQYEATLRQSVQTDGVYRDVAWYGMLAGEI